MELVIGLRFAVCLLLWVNQAAGEQTADDLKKEILDNLTRIDLDLQDIIRKKTPNEFQVQVDPTPAANQLSPATEQTLDGEAISSLLSKLKKEVPLEAEILNDANGGSVAVEENNAESINNEGSTPISKGKSKSAPDDNLNDIIYMLKDEEKLPTQHTRQPTTFTERIVENDDVRRAKKVTISKQPTRSWKKARPYFSRRVLGMKLWRLLLLVGAASAGFLTLTCLLYFCALIYLKRSKVKDRHKSDLEVGASVPELGLCSIVTQVLKECLCCCCYCCCCSSPGEHDQVRHLYTTQPNTSKGSVTSRLSEATMARLRREKEEFLAAAADGDTVGDRVEEERLRQMKDLFLGEVEALRSRDSQASVDQKAELKEMKREMQHQFLREIGHRRNSQASADDTRKSRGSVRAGVQKSRSRSEGQVRGQQRVASRHSNIIDEGYIGSQQRVGSRHRNRMDEIDMYADSYSDFPPPPPPLESAMSRSQRSILREPPSHIPLGKRVSFSSTDQEHSIPKLNRPFLADIKARRVD